MTLLNPESLSWVKQLEIIRALGPNASRTDRKKALKLSDGLVSNIINLEACFDPAAVEKVRQAAQADPPYILSSGSAKALVDLKKAGVSDLPGKVHAALDVIFTRRLATKQIKSLVKWMVSGKPVAEFDPRKKDKKSDEEKTDTNKLSELPTDVLDLKKAGELLKKAEAEKALGKETTAQEKLLDYLKAVLESDQSKFSSSKKKTQADSNWVETVFLSWLADVSLIKKIKSKVGKGQPVTRGEAALLWLHKFGEWAGWIGKHLFKALKPFIHFGKWIAKLLVDALKEIGIWKYIKSIFIIGLFVCFGWFAWEAWHYGFTRPFRLLEPYCFRKTEDTNGNNNEPLVQPSLASQLVASTQVVPHKTQSHETSQQAPAVVYQSSIAWQSVDEDQKILDTEIASLPVNCIVKDFPLTIDEGMPGDLAVSRLQDLTNPDKYTMKIGNGTQKILSVNPSTTNLTINYKSTDLLGLGDSGPMNFIWEDVTFIHINELDKEQVRSSELGSSKLTASTSNSSTKLTSNSGGVLYQCSLIVSGAKYPLTIQCTTPADLKHLVSTMEYFIRASRLAHDTALAGMPYPHQGLRLNDQCLVEVLWANSPVDKAGLTLGDMVWSMEKNTQDQPNRKKLETQLAALAPGQHDLYIVSPADRNAGLVQMNAANSNVFNPKRHKVVLTVF